MAQGIELEFPESYEIVGRARICFDWKPEPPDIVCSVRDAVIVYEDEHQEPLSQYGCFIRILDEADPLSGADSPFNLLFELVHEFLPAGPPNFSFIEWRMPKKSDVESPRKVIKPCDDI